MEDITRMNTRILYNPYNGADIINFPIEEAVIDPSTGDPVPDANSSSRYKRTGKTFEWTLRVEETLEFPSYVALILKDNYQFLKWGNPKRIKNPVKAEAESKDEEDGSGELQPDNS